MHKLNIAIVAGLLAVAVVLGSVAVTRTTGLGNASRTANEAAIAAKERQLASYQAKLHQALAAKTPKLPALPKASAGGSTGPATSAPTQRVIYRRPPPIVVVKHTHHGDDGAEHGGGSDD